MVQGQVFLNRGRWKYDAGAGLLEGRGWYFSYLIFSRFIIFTFRNYFTKSSSAAGSSQRQPTSADISSRRLVRPAADDDFVKLLYSLLN